ncbi:Protein TOXD [Verticillium dahliae VDG2]|nr:Protein TOXD [Verticillium dahliae VDG2]
MASTSKPQTPRLPLDISEIESSSDPEGDSEDSSAEDETPTIVRSPTKLTYKIDRLSDETRSTVREAFKDPPRLSLQYCRLQDDTYAFQMTEMVPRSIRIGSSESKFPTPRCSCGKQNGPCKHLLWLLDQLVKQTLYDQDPASPLTMTSKGFAEEVGDPFSSISDFHLDVLADSLRCRVVHPDSGNDDDDDDDDDDEDLDPSRVQEARELLASVAAVDPEEYREDIFTDPTPGTNIIKRRDLECTIFRMLLDNNDFFHYFLSRARSSDPIKDPFNKLEQRGPRNVAWAARHILGVTTLINTTIFKRDTPLTSRERTSAARALVRILAAVTARNRDAHPAPTLLDRNLYARLIGDAARPTFIIDTLLLLPDAAAPFLSDLETVAEAVGVHGAPAAYAEKLSRLLASLKKPARSGSGSKRQDPSGGQGPQGRGSKRVK